MTDNVLVPLDGARWLWRFACGRRFVMATDPLLDEDENRSTEAGA